MSVNDSSLPAEAVPLEAEKSLGELFAVMTRDLGDLVTTHINLAKAEIKEEASETGKAAGVFGVGVFAGYMAVIMLSFATAWALASLMPTWVGFFVVAVAWGVAAVILVVTGRTKFQAVHGPEQTVEAVKEDVQWAKHQRN